MAYSIEYYRESQVFGSDPWPGSLQKGIAHAEDEMKSRRADFVRIIDADGSGTEIWSGRSDAQET